MGIGWCEEENPPILCQRCYEENSSGSVTHQSLCQQSPLLWSGSLVMTHGGRDASVTTFTPLPLSSGICRSSPSLQVYRQSITFLSANFPERIVRPARSPRKNWVMCRSPPLEHGGERQAVTRAAQSLRLRFSRWCYRWWQLDGWTCGLVQSQSC